MMTLSEIIPAMIKERMDEKTEELLKRLPPDGREIYLLEDGAVRMTSVSANTLVNEMRANHRTGIIESYVLGQAYIAGALLSSVVKGNDRVKLEVECGGPIKGITVESWACGAVRGYLLNNPIPLEKEPKGLDTSPLFGPGFLSVSKILEGAKEPVTGTVMMESGNIAKDLALYFLESEQTPTIVYISISFDNAGSIVGAGGLFIQAMPGCKDEVLDRLQEKSGKLSKMGDRLRDGISASEYAEEEFKDFGPKKIGHSPIGFSCPCDKKKFEGYLKALPKDEKEGILKGSFPLEVECFNCSSKYSFSKDEVEALFK